MEAELFALSSQNDEASVAQRLRTLPDLDVNWRNNAADGWTSLHVASCYGHVQVVELLLRHPRINVNQQDNAGHSPLHLAGFHKRTEILRIFLTDPRINVNLANDDGETLLYHASYDGDLEMVQLLMASCLDLDLEKKDPLGCARWLGRTEVICLFENLRRDPEGTRWKLRRRLKLNEPVAGEVFALTIFLCDNYLRLREDLEKQNPAARYFRILRTLPMDLQMMLCNRTLDLAGSVIRQVDSERGFKKLGRYFSKLDMEDQDAMTEST